MKTIIIHILNNFNKSVSRSAKKTHGCFVKENVECFMNNLWQLYYKYCLIYLNGS